MPASQPNTPPPPRRHRWRSGLPRLWSHVLDLALTIWVVRVPFVALTAGLLLLSFVPQAQDLMVELAPDSPRVGLFLALLVAWIAVTAYASYLVLETDRRYLGYVKLRGSPALDAMRAAAPFVLGALPCVIVIVATIRSYWNLPDIPDQAFIKHVQASLGWLTLSVAIVLAIFVFCCLKRPPYIDNALAFGEGVAQRVDAWLAPHGFSLRVDVGLAPKRPHFLGPLLLAIVFVASAVIFWFGPNNVAQWLPRALVIPVVLGGWLPLLTWLAAAGRRVRAPLVAGGLLTLAVLSALLGDNHSVRRIAGADLAPQPRSEVDTREVRTNVPPMTLNRAVNLWMDENHCRPNPSQCPRPIIVAGAGGASRAGFLTAGVIGQLLDRKQDGQPVAGLADEATVRNRIFAISGVSGSAVGAVMTVAALARAGKDTKQPCAATKPPLWYGGAVGGWRDCLETLMAGDFLSPTLLGLIFNDRISFGWWQDRAAVLEQAWEDRFSTIIKTDANADLRTLCPGDLRCPFMTLQPKEGLWLPLLLLNGSSVATGRRIITTILTPSYIADDCPTVAATQNTIAVQDRAPTNKGYVSDAPTGRSCELFLESNRFHPLLTSSSEPGFWTSLQLWLRWEYLVEKFPFIGLNRVLDDVRLSTAAHNSARFPLISPPGAIRNLQHQVIDRVVDGGYIENYGALTAMELAQAVHAIEPKLAPFVLTISNDPDDDPGINLPDAPDSSFLSDTVIPIEAIMNARTGRGRLAVKQVEAVLDHLAKPECGDQSAHLRVWPQSSQGWFGIKTSRPVSMSWWLSQPIQIHLHQQTEKGKSQNQNEPEIDKMWRALLKPSSCQGLPLRPSAVEMQMRSPAPQ